MERRSRNTLIITIIKFWLSQELVTSDNGQGHSNCNQTVEFSHVQHQTNFERKNIINI